MFTGIIEDLAEVISIESRGSNIVLEISNSLDSDISIDQSIAHNGVCLTVIEIGQGSYKVELVKESLDKSSLGNLVVGDLVNIERCLQLNDRLDGHLVQGHVDCTTTCTSVSSQDGSWIFQFDLPEEYNSLIVSKGSICINGVSLTVAMLEPKSFSVAIIPYTYEHTNFKTIKPGSEVNLEFDILGKYVQRILDLRDF